MDAHAGIQRRLDHFILIKNIPHILFHGASGAGKRTLAHNFLARIYEGDKQRIKSSVMEVNCAHGKGIKFIRGELKSFARANIQTCNGVCFKSIVLYNAEHLTVDAQSALRRCIEIFSHNTRFFIITENKHRLFTPVLSRFCEVYVPTPMRDGGFINLHAASVDARMPAVPRAFEAEARDIAELAERVARAPDESVVALREAAQTLYAKGLSAADVVGLIADMSPPGAAARRASLAVLFLKVRADFRNEKFFIWFLLDFWLLRSDEVLKDVTEI